MFLKNVKARYLWIATGIVFLITVGLIILLITVKDINTTVVTVCMIIGFVLMTFLVQAASFKSFGRSLDSAPTPSSRSAEVKAYP